jgi:hypothetical protein
MIHAATHKNVSGYRTLNSQSWSLSANDASPITPSLVLDAKAGDVIVFGCSVGTLNENQQAYLDAVTVVGGAIKHHFTTPDPAGKGIAGLLCEHGTYNFKAATGATVLSADDIESGKVTVALAGRVDGGQKSLIASDTHPLVIWAANLS